MVGNIRDKTHLSVKSSFSIEPAVRRSPIKGRNWPNPELSNCAGGRRSYIFQRPVLAEVVEKVAVYMMIMAVSGYLAIGDLYEVPSSSQMMGFVV